MKSSIGLAYALNQIFLQSKDGSEKSTAVNFIPLWFLLADASKWSKNSRLNYIIFHSIWTLSATPSKTEC